MTESGDAGVVITNKDIYDKVSDVEKSVLAMAPQAQTLIDHETRMRVLEQLVPEQLAKRLLSLEKWKYSIPASATAAVVAIVEQLVNKRG